jgi:hypothetical protein
MTENILDRYEMAVADAKTPAIGHGFAKARLQQWFESLQSS